jgi:hypothetical protein
LADISANALWAGRLWFESLQGRQNFSSRQNIEHETLVAESKRSPIIDMFLSKHLSPMLWHPVTQVYITSEAAFQFAHHLT